MNYRVVAIDDEPSYLQLIQEFAALSSIDSLAFNKWDETILDLLTDHDLVFLDIHMPDTDGIDILMKLNEANFKGGVVVLSGADESVVNSTKKLGDSLELRIIDLLSKPFLLRDFRECISSFDFSWQQPNSGQDAIDQLNISLDDIPNYLDSGWLYPVYQPQVDPNSNHVSGIECLSRMNHPEHGFIAPPVFIEHFAEKNIIEEYTLLLIEQALSECRPLLLDASELIISFNISASSLNQGFTKKLLEIISSSEIAPNQITLEVTETHAISLTQDALYAVSKFRAAGMNLSVDDFGTGYSTITQLNELPFNELKIDRSFIIDITENTKTLNIVNATILLANSLSLKVVAEGVETEEQLNIIKNMGCTAVQGYIYAKPMELTDLQEYLQDATRRKQA